MKYVDEKVVTNMINVKNRYMGSYSNLAFVGTHIDSLPGCNRDSVANRYVIVGEDPYIAFTCSMNESVDFREPSLYVTLGIYVMGVLIRNQVPGVYIFHRKEGLEHVINYSTLLDGVELAVSFNPYAGVDIASRYRDNELADENIVNRLAYEVEADYIFSEENAASDAVTLSGVVKNALSISVGMTSINDFNLNSLDSICDKLVHTDWYNVVYGKKPFFKKVIDYVFGSPCA